MTTVLKDYMALTKPTIMLLVLFTGAAALVVEGSFLREPVSFLLVMVGLFLTGGAANALNQFFERNIDARMSRTAKRRPLPLKRITPGHALLFSITIGAVGVLLFAWVFNWLVASLALATILFYALIYTLLLKPTTPQNIVIGGAAGAMAPVGAWAAATGEMAVAPWLMFAIIFFWTPPHFWALALYCKDDYVKAGLPMMPLIKGDNNTRRLMAIYSVIVVVISLLLIFFGSGWFYFAIAVLLGAYFLRAVWVDRKERTENSAKRLFAYSIVYLLGLFTAVMVDQLVLRLL